MSLRSWMAIAAIAVLPPTLVHPASGQTAPLQTEALPTETLPTETWQTETWQKKTSQKNLMPVSDVYIEQSHGRVAPGSKVQAKPVPEATGAAIQSTGPTAPTTCNAQNASSQACYTATQQARPATR
jgi:hypothetical protein